MRKLKYTLPKEERIEAAKRSTTIPRPLKLQPKEKEVQQKFMYYVGGGNNSFLVRRVLSTRKNWFQTTDSKQIFINMKWQQSNKNFKYENCIDNRILKHSVNHFEFHYQLSNKEYLLKNIMDYCEANKINAMNFLPISFNIDTYDSSYEADMSAFIKYYQQKKPSSRNEQDIKNVNLKKKRGVGNNSLTMKTKNSHCKYQIQEPFMDQNSQYLWILKPTSLNRGVGIHVFNSLLEMESLMNKYIFGYLPEGKQNTMSNSSQIIKKSFRIRQLTNHLLIKSTSFIVQKYLQKPLLFNGRKFDIRVWVLVTHQMKVYFFRQGYVRTSSYKYETDNSKIADLNIHLTNNAVQKNNEDYGKYQKGNQLSFRHLRRLIEDNGQDFDIFISNMKQIIKISMLSVKKKLNRMQRKWCFQLFGYDFMLDRNCKPWLIEVNTNPCLEESSPILQQLLPRMLDDFFCLTIDKMFNTQKNCYSYVIEHESNSQNLWDLLIDLRK